MIERLIHKIFFFDIILMIILCNQSDRCKSLKLSKNMLPNRRLPNGNHHHIHTYMKAHVRSIILFILNYHNIHTPYAPYSLEVWTRLLDICVPFPPFLDVLISLVVMSICLMWFVEKREKKNIESFFFF